MVDKGGVMPAGASKIVQKAGTCLDCAKGALAKPMRDCAKGALVKPMRDCVKTPN